jgi:hypothetical protein
MAIRTGLVTVTGNGITRNIQIAQYPNCRLTTIVPYVKVGEDTPWVQTSTVVALAGSKVKFGPKPEAKGSWLWTGPNGFTYNKSDLQLKSVQPYDAGEYIAYYTNETGCISSQVFTVSVTGAQALAVSNSDFALISSKAEIREVEQVVVYPNPVEDRVTISVPSIMIGATMTVSSASGSIVFNAKVTELATGIDMSALPAGLYVVTIRGNSQTLSSKILKK